MSEDTPQLRTDKTVPEMRAWLRNWVADATGQSPDRVSESAPMVELGLSSRDAVAMATDIEDFTGVTVTATTAFRHPTIEALAQVIVEGEPEQEDVDTDAEDWSRDPRLDDGSYDIAIVGLGTRFPGDMNTPAETWQALLEGRDAITDLPEGRWEEFLSEPRSPNGWPGRAPAAATSPISRASTRSSSRCRRWKPTTSTRSSGWRWS